MYIIKEENFQLDLKKIKSNPIPKDLKTKWMKHGGVNNPEYKKWIKLHWIKETEITKGGKGPIGSKVKAPNGEYIHQRKQDPDKYIDYKTIKKDGKLLRLGKTKDNKWEVQSALTKESVESNVFDSVVAYTAKGSQLSSRYPFTKEKENLLIKNVSKSKYKGTLYRGQWYSEKQWDNIYEIFFIDGSIYDFNLNLISFTKDSHRTGSYGTGGDIFVKFKLVGTCTGLDISKESIYPEEQEVLVCGKNKFKIVSSDSPRMGSFIVEIKEI